MDIFAYSMLCFTSLFTLMDPLGVMPVFLQMTEGMSAGERRSIALKSCALTFVILVLHLVRQVPVPFFRDLDQWFPNCGRYHHL